MLELVPLRGDTKKCGATPTKQDLGTSQGFFSKFPTSIHVTFIWESPRGPQHVVFYTLQSLLSLQSPQPPPVTITTTTTERLKANCLGNCTQRWHDRAEIRSPKAIIYNFFAVVFPARQYGVETSFEKLDLAMSFLC